MKKKLLSILLCLLIIIPPLQLDAGGIDIINNAIHNKTTDTRGRDLINKALRKGSQEVKILDTKKEVKQLKQEKVKLKTKKKQEEAKKILYGLDVSKWNGNIDFDEIKEAGIDFIIIRAGYGTTVDKKFKRNIEGAIKHDLLVGIYWFSYAYTPKMAYFEAKKCYKTIKKYKKHITLPIFYDFEYDSVNYARKHNVTITKAKASNYADTFCSTIRTCSNRKLEVGIYTNLDYANNYFSKEVLAKYHTWIACWNNSCVYKGKYIMWQKSDKYYIGNSRYDFNILYYSQYLRDKSKKKQGKSMKVSATYYGDDKITSLGTVPTWGTIAVDPKVIAYGSRVYIPKFDKTFIAEDCGGRIKGNRIDIFVGTESRAYRLGVIKDLEIIILN